MRRAKKRRGNVQIARGAGKGRRGGEKRACTTPEIVRGAREKVRGCGEKFRGFREKLLGLPEKLLDLP
ncbi:MAG TPA: hypothetical protein VF159_05550 [Gemmatimonadaceae bacterium]